MASTCVKAPAPTTIRLRRSVTPPAVVASLSAPAPCVACPCTVCTAWGIWDLSGASCWALAPPRWMDARPLEGAVLWLSQCTHEHPPQREGQAARGRSAAVSGDSDVARCRGGRHRGRARRASRHNSARVANVLHRTTRLAPCRRNCPRACRKPGLIWQSGHTDEAADGPLDTFQRPASPPGAVRTPGDMPRHVTRCTQRACRDASLTPCGQQLRCTTVHRTVVGHTPRTLQATRPPTRRVEGGFGGDGRTPVVSTRHAATQTRRAGYERHAASPASRRIRRTASCRASP